jgi:AmpD protein
MKINAKSGLVEGVQFMASPNCDGRPSGVSPELIVIHNISLPPGKFGGDWIVKLFTNTLDPQAHPYFAEVFQLKVSAHVLIHRDGRIVQFVPFHQRAWHAGQSSYQGRSHCNDFSIGIELEGTDEIPYDPLQYKVLASIIEALLIAYPTLCVEHIIGHEHIAPGRKTDPGSAFDWGLCRKLLANAIGSRVDQ